MLGLQRDRRMAGHLEHGARPAQAAIGALQVAAAAGEARFGEVGAKGNAVEIAFGADGACPRKVGIGSRVLTQQRQHLRADYLGHADEGVSLRRVEQVDRCVELSQRRRRIVELEAHDGEGHAQESGAASSQPAPVACIAQPVFELAGGDMRLRAQVVDDAML